LTAPCAVGSSTKVTSTRSPGILTVSVAVMLAEPRRYWLDRDLTSGLGQFHAPALL